MASSIERLMLADELGLARLRTACVKFLTTAQNLEVALVSRAGILIGKLKLNLNIYNSEI